MLAQFMIWGGTVALFLAIAALEIDHEPTFFGVSRALRSALPVKAHEEFDPELIEILGDIEV